MRICHIFAAAVLGLTALSAGEAAAFSMQNSGSGDSATAGGAAGSGAGANYLDPDAKLMREMMSGGSADGASKFAGGSGSEGPGGLFGPKSGFSMKLQQTGPSDTAGANRYFSTDQNPWK